MNVEIGQWVRFINNYCEQEILQIKKFEDYIYIPPLGIDEGKIVVLIENLLIKVADTPQELIQVGDLYEINNSGIPKYIEDKEQLKYLKRLKFMKYNKITKIYTPNEDKTQYTLQWEQTT